METTITRISRTRKGRFALFCDAGFLFSVDEETFFTEHLVEGLTLDDGQLDELLRKSDAQRAKDKAFGYLSAREHGNDPGAFWLATAFKTSVSRLERRAESKHSGLPPP